MSKPIMVLDAMYNHHNTHEWIFFTDDDVHFNAGMCMYGCVCVCDCVCICGCVCIWGIICTYIPFTHTIYKLC